jgi:deoxyribodipyrimidine photo-lyase
MFFIIAPPRAIVATNFPISSHYKFLVMPQKRKLATRATIPSAKKIQTTLTRSKPEASLKFESSKPTAAGALSSQPFVQSADYDEGIVDRKYYPLAGRFSAGNTSDPMSSLKQALSSTAGFRTQVVPGRSVIHWFRTDLRIDDNTGLHLASKVSASATTITGHEGCALIGLYIISPQDLDAHVVAPARLDFILRSLEVVRKDLAERNIPLWIETVSKRKGIPAKIMELAQQWGSNHVFANMEYEVDELRRDAELVHLGERMDVAVNVLHDTCVVPPGELLTKVRVRDFERKLLNLTGWVGEVYRKIILCVFPLVPCVCSPSQPKPRKVGLAPTSFT